MTFKIFCHQTSVFQERIVILVFKFSESIVLEIFLQKHNENFK